MQHKNQMRILPIFAMTILFAMVLLACQEEKKNVVPNVKNAREVPTMVTRNVETFISDSGITRYHISADIWNIFEEAVVPRWTFPNGLFLEQYDDNFKQNAKVLCDSATFFSEKKLWRLDGEVIMVNEKRDSFLTTELYWDQRAKRIYSDSAFVRIVNEERVIEGYGFTSNERMTDYAIRRPTALFPAKNLKKNGQASGGTSVATQGNDSTASQPSSQPGENVSPAAPSVPERRGLKKMSNNNASI